jgi:hypothetical protein
MMSSEAGIALAFILSVALQLLVPIGLWAWGRWVARRHGGRMWNVLAWLPLISLGLTMLGGCVSSLWIVRSFGMLAATDAATRATVLAQNISEAMNFGAVFALLALGLYFVVFVALILGSLKKPPLSA